MAPQTRGLKTRSSPSVHNVSVQLDTPTLAPLSQSRERRSNNTHSNRITRKRKVRSNEPDEPPHFTIDLSFPPEQRYTEVCAALKMEMLNLTSLFDEVVGEMVPFIPLRWLHLLCKVFLRGVYSKEENAELKGISKITGVDMYLLVCFNVLLDLFMGCSSGGARVRAGKDLGRGSKMVHFRTLDWDMDPLRRVVVQLDYVLEEDGPVVATSVTYAGFVGVLTGVRKHLSMSLNFRHTRKGNGNFLADLRYRWHLLMVLLGWRPSISTTLRQLLLPRRKDERLPGKHNSESFFTNYGDVVQVMGGAIANATPSTTTCCYLCFSDGHETTVIEKDLTCATTRSSTDFIIVTNGDVESPTAVNDQGRESRFVGSSMQEIIEESESRARCAHDNWAFMRTRKLSQLRSDREMIGEDVQSLMELDDVAEMVQRYPTTNECTHFAAVMDPSVGDVKWCRRWMQPVNEKWIDRHSLKTF